MLTPHPQLTSLQKRLSQFAIVNGVMTILMPVVISMVFGQSILALIILIWLLLGGGSIVAGYFGLAGKAWAYWLLFVVFLIQVAEYFSQTSSFGIMGPLSLKFGWGWNDPPFAFNVNVVAVVVCILAARCANSIGVPGNRAAR